MAEIKTDFDSTGFKNLFPIFETYPSLHYLDNAATAQCPQVVLDAIYNHETQYRANIARSVYPLAEAATENYEQARQTLAHYLGSDDSHQVVFTSGATSAFNLLASAHADRLGPNDEIVLSITEHHSNLIPWQILSKRTGCQLRFLPITEDGRIDLSQLENKVTENCRLIALTHASNVTGTVTDIDKIVEAANTVNAEVALDGAQIAPHGPINLEALGVDYYVLSGHKMFGPNGIGVLWGKSDKLAQLSPPYGGGGMVRSVSTADFIPGDVPSRFEPGTPPIAQAIGLAAAAKLLMAIDQEKVETHLSQLTTELLSGLKNFKNIKIIGPENIDDRLGLVSFDIEGIHPHDICQILSGHDIAVRGGHHCAQPLMNTLDLMGTTRVSLAPYNDNQDIAALLEGLEHVMRIFK